MCQYILFFVRFKSFFSLFICMCGVIGVYGLDDVAPEIYKSLKLLVHRGRSGSGMITYDDFNIHPRKSGSTPDTLDWRGCEGSIGIGHTRYSTSGGDSLEELKRNAQPEYVINPFVAVAHNGNIYNYKSVIRRILGDKKPRTDCDVQALLLSLHKELKQFPKINEDSIFESLRNVTNDLNGSWSSALLITDKESKYLVGFTDPHKVRPLVVGKKEKNDERVWYITSENSVLKGLGVEYVMDVPPGSAVFVNPEWDKPKVRTIKKDKAYHCMFEWIYFANRNSEIEGVSVHDVRCCLGKELARKYPVRADGVVPVPESGRAYATGYARESKLPIIEGLQKREKTRTFMLQTQEERDKEALENIMVIEEAVKGKKIVLVDDSLIRGTNMKNYNKKLRRAGAKEVHVRIGCPPLVNPCYFGIDMRTKKEFIARRDDEIKGWDEIAKEIGVDSLAYTDMDTLRKCIIGDKNFDICTGCLHLGSNGYPPDMGKDIGKLLLNDKESRRAYE